MSSKLDLGILLGAAYQAFTDELRRELEVRGFDDLGSAYGYVFRALAAAPLHQQELARRLGMTPPGAAKIVSEMVERGYVERRPDPDDARAKHLVLAQRGRAALAAARRFHAAYESRLATIAGERSVAAARRTLEAMLAASGADPATVTLRAF